MSQNQTVSNPGNWLKDYGNLLYQYALARIGNQQEAEDLLQDTFLSAIKGLDQFKGEASEKNWLFAILKNKIVDYFRKKSANRVVSELPGLEGDLSEWFDEDGRWPLSGKPAGWNPANSDTERKEFRKIISHCKDALKDLQQQVFVLKYLEGYESDFICKVLNITASNYWVLLHRGRLQMRACVEKHWLKN